MTGGPSWLAASTGAADGTGPAVTAVNGSVICPCIASMARSAGRRRMPDGERCRRAVCERTACTVRKGAAGEADAHGEAETSTGRETARTEPDRLPANDQPAAYLTGY